MSCTLCPTQRALLAGAFTAVLISEIALLGSAVAQQPSSDEILKALLPKTRDFRGVAIEPGAEGKPPSIDLYINFKFDSAELEPDALRTLKALGQALQSSEL